MRRKMHEECVDMMSKGIRAAGERSESYWTLFYIRGVCYERTNRFSRAEPDFTAALRLAPEDKTRYVQNYLGYSMLVRSIDLPQAHELIASALQSGEDGSILDSFGWLQYLEGNYVDAADVLEAAVEMQPASPTISDHLGDVLWTLGRSAEAKVCTAARF
jgi:Flp pilus assembly protein TadD